MSEEAHDHRELAQRLDLLHFREEAPGMVFWHPAGHSLYRLLEEASREVTAAHGYAEVKTPQVLRRPVWQASGHWEHFAGGMFRVDDQSVEAAIKPVSCPGHVYVAERSAPSYRDLPLRYAELGVVHRDEPSGTLHGLLRLRQFTQDDGHVFCADEDQAEAEVLRFCRAVPAFYRAFGFSNVSLAFSTRPDDRAGDDALWNRAESALRNVLERLGGPFVHQPGAGAFYGPKLEYTLHDRHGRPWQCGTIQFDLVMPARFGLQFVDRDGRRRAPVMLHRALYGSLERFLGILLEHHAGALPPWMAPSQIVVLPVGEAAVDSAERVHRELRAAGLRATWDADDSLAKRLARAHVRGIPFQAIVGVREAAQGALTLRGRGGEQATHPLDAALAELQRRCARPPFAAAA